ncbi:MAG: ABC transporter substrate-binding protein [Sporomusaceae bacterium]|jgi:iron(III) transport system substrate-binding protein|nr:ABC transporter substrate-binding protein [Sporomusaceae bacterium]
MKLRGKMVALAIAALMLAVCLAGCGGDTAKPSEPAKDAPKAAAGANADVKGTLMIYTSIYPDIIELIKPEVKKAFPNLEVEWFQAGTEKVMAKVAGEIEAKKIQADMLMVADPSYYLYLKDQGLLEPYDAPNRKDIAINKDTEGYWTGVRISNMIIAYNSDKTKLEDAPKTWNDLLDPKWKGKISMPSPLLSGTAYVYASVLADKYGWEYFDKLRANDIKVEAGNSAIQNKLLTGEYLAAVILEENILKMADKGEPIKVIYPEDGVVIIPSPVAIFKASQNQEAAKALSNWFLSKEGQEIIVKGWMHSTREDVAPPKGAPELKSFAPKAFKIDWAKLATENEKNKELFRAKVLDK